jgi:WD40 repeat protein/serine/threonine protein kinase
MSNTEPGRATPQVDADRNLLFAVVALKGDLVSRENLIAGMNAWALDRSKSLGDILIEKGYLRPDRRAWIDAMVAAQLEESSNLLETVPTQNKLTAYLGSTAETLRHPTDASATPAAEGAANPPAAWPVIDSSAPTMPLGTPSDLTVVLRRGNGQDVAAPTGPPAAPAKLRFRLMRLHARGGLGQVYVAFDEELGREVALKEIQDKHADDPRSKARFVLEAEITGGLEHPGIVPVYSLNWYRDGRPYYAMRFIRGETYGAAIERYHANLAKDANPSEAALEVRELLRRFLDICNAIGYAHSRGVLHRDLKPNNVMLGKYGETLVVDWGLAKSIALPEITDLSGEVKLVPSSSSGSAETLPGAAIGTPQFMSPEQAAGQLDRMGPASDIYSLGAVLYAVLTGRSAFESPDIAGVLKAVQLGQFPPPRSKERTVPPALEAVCLKAMALRPEDRYPTPRALAEDIEHWLADEPVSAFREPWLHRLARWSRRHRTWAQAGAAALALVAIVSFGASIVINGEHRREQIARKNAQAAQRKAEVLGAGLILDRSLNLFARGHSGRAMLNLAYGLTLLHPNEHPQDRDLDRCFRTNISGWRMRHSTLHRLLAHPDGIYAVAFGAHDKVILTGGGVLVRGEQIGEARLWTASSGELIGSPIFHPKQVRTVAFSGDGAIFVTGCEDGFVRLWETATRRPIGSPLNHGDAVLSVAFNQTGDVLASAGADGKVRLWSSKDGKPLAFVGAHPAAVRSVAFSPTAPNTQLVTGCADGLVRIWDIDRVTARVGVRKHDGSVNSVAYRPDGRVVASGGSDGIARIWDANTGQIVGPRPIEHAVGINAVAFNPAGNIIATGTEDNNSQLWMAETTESYSLPLEHRGSVMSLAFSSDGKSLLTGSADSAVRVWIIPPETADRPLPRHSGPINALEIGPGAKTILTAGQDGLVDIRDGTGKPICPPLRHPRPVRAAELSPDGATAITGCDDGIARIWNVASGELLVELAHQPAPITAVAFRNDGKAVITGCLDGKARMWLVSTGARLGPEFDHNAPVVAVDYRHDDEVVLTAGGTRVHLWVPTSNHPLEQSITHPGPIYTAIFSPGGTLILTGGENNTANLWNAETCEPFGLPMIHRASVVAADFSPDGLVILTGSHDRSAQLWDATTGVPLGPPMTHPARLSAVAFGPLNKWVLTGDEQGNTRLWDVPSPVPGTPRLITLWVRAFTGMRLDAEEKPNGLMRVLDPDSLRETTATLSELGGPPMP